jgi:hypothetical protein
MLLSFELPPKHLNDFKNELDYGFVLTHMVLENEDYATFYETLGKDLLLDNSAYELGEALPAKDIIKAAKRIKLGKGHNGIVALPDVRNNADKTIKRVVDSLAQYKKALPKLTFMVVPQGGSPGQVINCAMTLIEKMKEEKVDFMLGIPARYDYTGDNVMSEHNRIGIVEQLLETTSVTANQIHLLGLCNAQMLTSYSRVPFRSMDTSLPIEQGFRKTLISKHLSEKPTKYSWRENPTMDKDQIEIAKQNIAFMKVIINANGSKVISS